MEGGGGGAGHWGGTTAVPTHPTPHGIGGGGVGGRLCLSFVFSFIIFLGAHLFFRGQGRAEGTRGACNEPPRADSGGGSQLIPKSK